MHVERHQRVATQVLENPVFVHEFQEEVDVDFHCHRGVVVAEVQRNLALEAGPGMFEGYPRVEEGAPDHLAVAGKLFVLADFGFSVEEYMTDVSVE